MSVNRPVWKKRTTKPIIITIDLTELYYIPFIYDYDYEAMKRNNQDMEEELIKEVMKPSRVFKWYNCDVNNNNYDYLEELFG